VVTRLSIAGLVVLRVCVGGTWYGVKCISFIRRILWLQGICASVHQLGVGVVVFGFLVLVEGAIIVVAVIGRRGHLGAARPLNPPLR